MIYIVLIFVLIILKTIYYLCEILKLNKNNDDYFINKNDIFSKFNIENYNFSWFNLMKKSILLKFNIAFVQIHE